MFSAGALRRAVRTLVRPIMSDQESKQDERAGAEQNQTNDLWVFHSGKKRRAMGSRTHLL